jgi:hypothetical protein
MGQHIAEHVYEHDDGQQFGTGCRPPKHPECFAIYGEAEGQRIYTRDQLKQKQEEGKNSLAPWVVAILNQIQHPWCWTFMSVGIEMSALWLAGMEKVILDPAFNVKITGEYGGNAIDAAIMEVQTEVGAITAEYSGNDPVGGDVSPNRIPRDFKVEAAKRIVPRDRWVRLPSIEAMCSAIADGKPCGWGVDWQGGGHALQVMEYQMVGHDIDVLGPNSWGKGYSSGYRAVEGRPGWYHIPERSLRGCWDGACFGAYALCGVKDAAVV